MFKIQSDDHVDQAQIDKVLSMIDYDQYEVIYDYSEELKIGRAHV